ncbi:MAG: hypothetical protein ACW967_01525 [Candidatus Hodarchaeales archaeon]|jgi:hypothetical protein
MVLNRPLRPRKRKLPPPPNQIIPNLERNIPQEPIQQPISPTQPDFPQSDLPPLISSEQKLPASPYSGTLSSASHNPQPTEGSQSVGYLQQNTGKTELLSELADVISQGVGSKLKKVDFDSLDSEKDLDYATILKNQFEKAMEDYLEAGRKFQESGLKSNAAMSYACAIFSSILGSGENYARHHWNIIKEDAGDEFKTSTLFDIIEQMFNALDKRSKEEIYKVLNLLKKLDTFSLEDQELIANTASYLVKRSEIF